MNGLLFRAALFARVSDLPFPKENLFYDVGFSFDGPFSGIQ
jgi:hypothetical protein